MKTLYKFLIFITLILSISLPTYAQQAPRTLTAFRSVSGSLGGDQALSQDWQFEGQLGQVVSLVAETSSGDLDTVLELWNAQNQLLAANDNSAFDNNDARIEAFPLPQDGIYTVRVYREGLETGNTSGTYQLTLLNGFSSFGTADSITRIIQTDSNITQRELLTIPEVNFGTIFELFMPNSTLPYQLEWRFHENASFTWTFQHDPQGNWTISLLDKRGNAIRKTGGLAADLLPGIGENATFTFRLFNQVFEVAVNAQPIGSITSFEDLSDMNAGQLIVTLSTEENFDRPLIASVRDLWLTTPFYIEPPIQMGAISPTPPGERIYTFAARPLDIVDELRSLDYIPTSGGGIQSSNTEGFVYSDTPGFNAYPLIEREFQNFVLGYTSMIWQGQSSTACGVIFRQENSTNFATVLNTPARGLYFLQYRNGNPDGLNIFSPALLPDIGAENRFVVVVREGRGTLFVNGRLAGIINLRIARGGIASHIVLDAESPSYCQISDLWVWSLD